MPIQAGSNTISLFSIDPSAPTNINKIGNPVSSEGEFPISLAFNADGSQLCTLNGGTVNNVMCVIFAESVAPTNLFDIRHTSCYTVDKKAGLKAIPNTLRSLGLNQTTPATGPAGSASHVIFSEDGKQLFASVKGTPPSTPGFIAAFDVQEDGTLSSDFKSIPAPSGGLLPFSMSVIPGKNALLVTDPGVGFDIIDLAGNSSSAVKIDGQSATCWSSFSKKTGNLYLTDIGTSIVTEVEVDDNLNAKIVKVRILVDLPSRLRVLIIIVLQQYNQTAGSATIDNDIATIGSNE